MGLAAVKSGGPKGKKNPNEILKFVGRECEKEMEVKNPPRSRKNPDGLTVEKIKKRGKRLHLKLCVRTAVTKGTNPRKNVRITRGEEGNR